MPYKLLLITGVPGMGKTTIGEHLQNKYAFLHFDVELIQTWSLPIQKSWFHSPETFITELKKLNRDIVITWGFVPNDIPTQIRIHSFKNSGFKLIWLDGNREAAKKAFIKRGTVTEELLGIQMRRIEATNISGIFQPIVFNTFDTQGNFLSEDEIVKKLLSF